jgi:hypothetical protein
LAGYTWVKNKKVLKLQENALHDFKKPMGRIQVQVKLLN